MIEVTKNIGGIGDEFGGMGLLRSQCPHHDVEMLSNRKSYRKGAENRSIFE